VPAAAAPRKSIKRDSVYVMEERDRTRWWRWRWR